MAPGSGAPLGHKLEGELWEPLQRLVFGFSTSPLGCRPQAEVLWKLCQWDRLPLGSPTAVAHADRHRPLPPAASKEQKRGE